VVSSRVRGFQEPAMSPQVPTQGGRPLDTGGGLPVLLVLSGDEVSLSCPPAQTETETTKSHLADS
jgi:hypothetical protein